LTAKRLVDEGRLTEAAEQLQKDLVIFPDDLARHTFLFELLGFAGELDRAMEQLAEIERLDPRPEARTGVQAYRVVLEAERARYTIFESGGVPRFFADPPAQVALHLEALDLCRAGHAGAARRKLDEALSLRRTRSGFAAGKSVNMIHDADDLLAPVLEVVTTAGYHWVPWENIQFLHVPSPQHLRDLLWTPARLATYDGLLGEVYLLNLYPGSHRHEDETVRLGRVTTWIDAGSGISRGAGQKLFIAGEESLTLLEIGEVQFVPEVDENASVGDASEESP
jgi:type VI secretion system protein ImpE